MMCVFTRTKLACVNKLLRFGLITCLLTVVAGCNVGFKEERTLKIGDLSFSEHALRAHLLEQFDQQDKSKRHFLWKDKKDGTAKKYLVYLSKDLMVHEEQIRASLKKAFAKMKHLTGVSFDPDDIEDKSVDVVLTFSKNFLEVGHLKAFKQLSRSTMEETIASFKPDVDTNLLTLSSIEYDSLDIPSSGNMMIAMLVNDEDELKMRSSNRFDLLAGRIATELYYGKAQSSSVISSSHGSGYYSQPPYIWPFDQALLKTMYARPELNGLLGKEVVDILVDDMAKKYTVNSSSSFGVSLCMFSC